MAEPALQISEILPFCFSGFIREELSALSHLNWKIGRLDQFRPSENSYFVLGGRVVQQNEPEINLRGKLLGGVPFVRKVLEASVDLSHHMIAWVPTEELTAFLLTRPAALRSYIQLQKHAGCQIIASWKTYPDIHIVSSEKPDNLTPHFSATMAGFLARQSGEKSVVIEWQSQGTSLFEVLGLDAPVAAIQREGDPAEETAAEVMGKAVSLTENVDLLNLHYGSLWKVSHDEFAALYRELRKKYGSIVLHRGFEGPDFSSSEACYEFHLYRRHPVSPADRPPSLQVRAGAPDRAGDLCFSLLHDEQQKEKADDWFLMHFPFLVSREAVYLGDSFNNPAGLLAVLRALNGKAGSDLPEIFRSRLVLAEGVSSVLTALAASSGSMEEYAAIVERLHAQNFLSIFRPRYPRVGIFAQARIRRYLYKIFGSSDLISTGMGLPGSAEEEVTWRLAGDIVENLMTTSFPAGFVSGLGNRIHASVTADWSRHLGFAFRRGIRKVSFFHFSGRRRQLKSNLAEIILLASASDRPRDEISGESAEVWQIPVPEGGAAGSLWKKSDELMKYLEEL